MNSWNKIIFIINLCIVQTTFAQNNFKAIIKSKEDNENLVGAIAILQGTANGTSADKNGLLDIKNIQDGKQIIVFSYIGYETQTYTFNFPLSTEELQIIFLTTSKHELNEVAVSTTRISRNIEDIPP